MWRDRALRDAERDGVGGLGVQRPEQEVWRDPNGKSQNAADGESGAVAAARGLLVTVAAAARTTTLRLWP
jgi:hypothetical protein